MIMGGQRADDEFLVASSSQGFLDCGEMAVRPKYDVKTAGDRKGGNSDTGQIFVRIKRYLRAVPGGCK